jgi:hypothetical protein
VFLDYGIAAQICSFVDPLLSGHPDAASLRIEFQTVIFADQVISLKEAFGQRKQAVRTAVFEGGE